MQLTRMVSMLTAVMTVAATNPFVAPFNAKEEKRKKRKLPSPHDLESLHKATLKRQRKMERNIRNDAR